MNKMTIGLVLAALAAAAPASAENFNGPFVGAEIGWNHDKVGRSSLRGNPLEVNRSKDAAAGGLFAGYDLKFGQKFVLGAEAGVEVGIKDQIRRSESASNTVVDPKYTIELTGRAGVLINPDTLLYARGGYATTRVSISQAGKDGVIHDRTNLQGWTAGGGVEHVIGGGLSARAEYRFADLRKNGASLNQHQAMLGVGYHF